MDDSDHNKARHNEDSENNPEAEVASAPRSLASLLYESLLVEEVFGAGGCLIGMLDHRHRRVLILPARALNQWCHLKVATVDVGPRQSETTGTVH